jgi:hypothetical protein
VSGTAEGLINGVRQSEDLQLASTSIPGVYALRYEPKKEGVWLLVISIGQKNSGEMGQATMVVSGPEWRAEFGSGTYQAE